MFGTPQPSAGAIFGQVQPAATSSSSAFGGSGASLFASSSALPGSSNPIFGAPGATAPSGIGQGSAVPGIGGIRPEEKKSTSPIFGMNPPGKEEGKSSLIPNPAAPGALGGGFLGASNPAASRQTFGPTSASPLGGGLFSGSSATAAAPSGIAPLNPLAATSTSAGGAFSLSTTTNPATTSAATGGLFKPASATTSSVPPQNPPFGAPSSAAAPSGGLFGPAPASTSSAPSQNPPFGASSSTAAPSGGLFAPASATTSSAPSQNPPFGAPSSAAAPSGGLFGPASSAPSSGPAQSPHFGAPTSSTAVPSFSLPSSSATTSASTGFAAPSSSAPLLPQPPGKEEKKGDSSAQPYAPLQSLEEVKAAALNTKTIDEVFTKWRTTLTQLSSDFSVSAEEVKQKEIQLYEKMDNIYGVLEMCENLSTVYEQQKEQLETISKEQEYLNRCLNSISAQIEPYVKSEYGAQTLPVEERLTGMRSNYLSGAGFTSTREEIFQKSKNVGRELDDIESTLDHITTLVNEDKRVEKSHEGTEHILNSYYDTLKWIEGSTSDLKSRLQGIEATYNFAKHP